MSGPPVGQAGERDKITEISRTGVQMNATVDSMNEVGTQLGGGHQIEFDLTVHPNGGEDSETLPPLARTALMIARIEKPVLITSSTTST